jgi:hypothetical protein
MPLGGQKSLHSNLRTRGHVKQDRCLLGLAGCVHVPSFCTWVCASVCIFCSLVLTGHHTLAGKVGALHAASPTLRPVRLQTVPG